MFCLEILKLGCWPIAVGTSGGGVQITVVGRERKADRGRWRCFFPLYGFASLNYNLEGSAAAAEGGQGVGAS
jgi:hypothetical protein